MKEKFLKALEKTVQDYDKLNRFGFIGLIGRVRFEQVQRVLVGVIY